MAELGERPLSERISQGIQAVGAGFTGTSLAQIHKSARERQLIENLKASSDNPRVLEGKDAGELAISNPKAFGELSTALGTRNETRQKHFYQDAKKALDLMKAGQFQLIPDLIQNRIRSLDAVGAESKDLTLDFAQKFQKALQDSDSDAMGELAGGLAGVVAEGNQLFPELGLVPKEESFTLSPGQKRFKGGKEIASVAPKGMAAGRSKFIGTPSRTTKDGKNFLSGIVQKSDGAFGIEEVEVGGDFVSIIGETGEELTTRKIKQASGIEEEKLKKQIKFEPLLKTAIKDAQVKATIKGEALTDFARASAALPGLRESINQLKELAPIATSTFGGRALDIAIKETGFGSTKGANSRVKFIAIINNQVLPLLRQTFGAAFTEREGETLKATMGDPNATPEQKVLQLETFIEQKVRSIQSSQRQAGVEVTPTEELRTGQPAAGGVKFLGFE